MAACPLLVEADVVGRKARSEVDPERSSPGDDFVVMQEAQIRTERRPV